jgi:sugar lactone lactonase YvrE
MVGGNAMPMTDVQCVVAAGDAVGEGVLWSSENGTVYWTDVCRFLIHSHQPDSQAFKTWIFDEPVVALALSTEPGRLLVALGSKLLWWWPQTDRRMDHGFVLKDYPRVRLNDGRADPMGNFWVGSMRNNVLHNGELGAAGGQDGVMYRISPDGDVSECITQLGIANTLCWSPDQQTFYTADTLANAVWAYEFDARTGTLGSRRDHLVDYPFGAPDGSAMDAEGFLWNCRFAGNQIVRVSPQGKVDRVIQMPVKNITTASFGGPDMKTLYVTSASILRDPGERLAGSLWSIECDVPGLPTNLVRV